MSFESDLKENLISHFESIQVPGDLKVKVLTKQKSKKDCKDYSFTKKVVLVCTAIMLLTPVVTFGYSLLANQIYGSTETARQYGITESEYFRFNNKLNEAANNLTPKEFAEFIPLAKDLIFFMLQNGDMSTTDRSRIGQVDVTKLSPEKQREYNDIVTKIQPYFDKLNQAQGTK